MRVSKRAAIHGILVLFLSLVAITIPAQAHFLLNLNVRIMHVEHRSDGLRVYLRTPMPFLVADRVGPAVADGLPEPAPFTTNAMEDGMLVHYVAWDQLERNPQGLGTFAGDGYRFETADGPLTAAVKAVRVHRVGMQPAFATLDEAKAAFNDAQLFPDQESFLYVGDAVVDVVLDYPSHGPVYGYAVSSSLDPGLPGQDETANIVLDHGVGGTKIFRARGLLDQPIEISRSPLSAAITFVKEGVRHILEGVDHVLFVLCLVLGAASLRKLVWRVTGFTIGHSVTLTAGFFGFVPTGAWFVPTVETGIALSIIYAAAVAVLARRQAVEREWIMVIVTCAIGLLHGLGFSFVLHEILQIDSPNIWQSLIAFNIGVEVGQLMIVVVAWPTFMLIRRSNENAWRIGRNGLAAGCIAIATFWTGERALSILATL